MSKKSKLIKRIKSNPKDFTIDEADTLFKTLGFKQLNKGKTSGSRISYVKDTFKVDLHSPHPQKELKPYQVKHILNQLQKEGLI